MKNMNHYSWVLSFVMLAIAIVTAITVASIWMYVPASVCTVLYSGSFALRAAMWTNIAIAMSLPFCWCRRRDAVFIITACMLSRVLLMVPAALLLSSHLQSYNSDLTDVEGIYYLIVHSLPLWIKASIFLLNIVWYYLVFRFVKSVTAVPSWLICAILAIGGLCFELVSALYYSQYMIILSTMWLLIANLLGMVIVDVEKTGINGVLKRWTQKRPTDADHEKG